MADPAKPLFNVLRVDTRDADAMEQLGTKKKFWLGPTGPRRTLFKAEERGHGEDWSEKVACELAGLLGLPHVHYNLAYDEALDLPGVVTENFLAEDEALIHGNQMLLMLDPTYPAAGNRFTVTQHTINAIHRVVQLLKPPTGCPEFGQEPSAVGAFAGYLLLDAWTANQDRHHENWGAILRQKTLRLAPTYDHASCLARNLKDDRRQGLLDNDRIPGFAGKATSAIQARAGETTCLSTVAAFRAWSELAPVGAKYWLDRLRMVTVEATDHILSAVPPDRMTDLCRTFTLKLLQENRRRLLDGEKQ